MRVREFPLLSPVYRTGQSHALLTDVVECHGVKILHGDSQESGLIGLSADKHMGEGPRKDKGAVHSIAWVLISPGSMLASSRPRPILILTEQCGSYFLEMFVPEIEGRHLSFLYFKSPYNA